jgi:acetolactate synthase I/II/III large subunit
MEKSGAQILIDTLLGQGIDHCWGYPGGAILPFYDTMYNSPLKHYLVRHEQAAIHAAEGFAKATGKLGVCIATSGPGATNLVTGLADAKMDSVPVLAITGQVPTNAIGSDAFQECDIFGVSIPITKYNALLKSADDVARITQEAILVATQGRPGPALIDFPKDVQSQLSPILKSSDLNIPKRYQEEPKIIGDLGKLADLLNRAEKPLLYVGGGSINGNSPEFIKKLAEKAQIPVVSTLMGLGSFPGTHELSLGMLGMHGTAYANKAVLHCDCIFALGARFDDRVAGVSTAFAPNAVKLQVDIDPAEFNKRVTVDCHIEGTIDMVLNDLLPLINAKKERNWTKEIQRLKEDNPLKFKSNDSEIKPQETIFELWKKTSGNAIISTDVGQHQMWAAQYYPFNAAKRWLTSGGLGTMGFGFPAALGAQVGCPDLQTICITGDGSFQMNIQELATARMYNIPVKILLFNNGFLGMVRQWQELFYSNRFSASDIDYNPDFIKIASGYDIPAKRIEKQNELEKGLDFLMSTDDSCLLEVAIPQQEKVYPMIANGSTYEQMVDFDASSESGNLKAIVPNSPEAK